jgi:phage protein D
MDVRRVSIDLIYAGKNITKDITPDLTGFSYTEHASGEADDIAIQLMDTEGKWISAWAPAKGDIVKPTIATINWRKDGDQQALPCGTFVIDEPSYSGRPRTMSIGAVSTPSNTDFMTTPNSRSWKKASIKKIAESIVKPYNLLLVFDALDDPIIGFVEQSEQADVSFLDDLCRKNSLAMKISDQSLVIFSEAKYEARETSAILTESDMLSWSAKTTFTDTGYDGCQIEYMNHQQGKTHRYTFWAPGHKTEKVFKINEKAESLAEAERMAKSKLRELNKKEFTASITLPGSLSLRAGQTVRLQDLGQFNGKYFIDQLRHEIGAGFTTSIEIHRVLEGY